MIPFKPRLTCPDVKNKAYIKTTYGGLNHAIEGNPKGRIYEGSVLPNCVGYGKGRGIEWTGKDCLPNSYAENWWTTKDGFKRDLTPSVGSIVCWRKGKAGNSSDGAGHIASVEDVNSYGDILTSDSGWTGTKHNGRYWRLRWLRRVNGTYAIGTDYYLQGFIHVFDPVNIVPVADAVYRLYNPRSGFHFFTKNIEEANSLSRAGWVYEGVAWKATNKGAPVYRLYNPNDGDHVFTTDEREKDKLRALGWNYEGVAFESDGKTPIYRLYNPNSGEHFYTADKKEKDALVRKGWKNENIAFYATGGTQ